MIIATHDAKFHADEVFATAVLKLVYPKAEVIRTRDEEILSKADFLVDIGRRSDNEKFFDHHQIDFQEKRKDGLPYASAGLVWRKFYEKLTTKEVYEHLDKNIFKFIDAEDSGIKTYESKECLTYTIGSAVDCMNNPKKSNENFFVILDFVTKLLLNEILRTEKLFEARDIIKDKLKNNKEEFLVLDKYIPWREWVIGTRIKFIIYKGEDSINWCSRSVPFEQNSFKVVTYFPEEWAGLENKELEKITGIKGAKFCHTGRFICVAETKESAIELTKLALKNYDQKI